MLDCKPANTPINLSNKVGLKENFPPFDKGMYQILEGKLIYLSHTIPNISFAISVASQFMNIPTKEHPSLQNKMLFKDDTRKGVVLQERNQHKHRGVL